MGGCSFFANYKVTVINVDNQGAQKGKNKAQGGRRVMYTCHTPFWDAKNRYGLPEEVPFSYQSIAHIIEPGSTSGEIGAEPFPVAPPKAKENDGKAESKKTSKPKEKKSSSPAIPKDIQEALDTIAASSPAEDEARDSMPMPELDKRIPKKLRDLMITDQITDWDIENICEAKGYVPSGTKIWDYETVNPGLIEGGIIGNWASVVAQIREMNEKEEVPFTV